MTDIDPYYIENLVQETWRRIISAGKYQDLYTGMKFCSICECTMKSMLMLLLVIISSYHFWSQIGAIFILSSSL